MWNECASPIGHINRGNTAVTRMLLLASSFRVVS